MCLSGVTAGLPTLSSLLGILDEDALPTGPGSDGTLSVVSVRETSLAATAVSLRSFTDEDDNLDRLDFGEQPLPKQHFIAQI